MQGLDERAVPSSPCLEAAKAKFRESVPSLGEDRVMYPLVRDAIAVLSSHSLLQAVKSAGVDLY
jgi:histidine ammonia-lyase